MKNKKDIKILKFPSSLETERQVEAILFAAEEPLDVVSIKSRMSSRADVLKILASLQKQYVNRGIN